MPDGMHLILLPLRFNRLNEDRHHKSLGIAPPIRLQPLDLDPLRNISQSYLNIAGSSGSLAIPGVLNNFAKQDVREI